MKRPTLHVLPCMTRHPAAGSRASDAALDDSIAGIGQRGRQGIYAGIE
jgi:hypothetical protein